MDILKVAPWVKAQLAYRDENKDKTNKRGYWTNATVKSRKVRNRKANKVARKQRVYNARRAKGKRHGKG